MRLQNKMTVTQCLVGRDEVILSEAVLDRGTTKRQETLHELATIGGLCNAGEFDPADSNSPLASRRIMGDATDQAVLRFAQALVDVKELRDQQRVMHKVPFNSKNKYMIHVLCGSAESSSKSPEGLLLTIKGAPDILLPRCSEYIATNGDVCDMTDEYRSFVERVKDGWARQARRVILIAKKPLKGYANKSIGSVEFENSIVADATSGLRLIGLVGIVDPPRPEIPEVISTLRGAGIKVFMVTGDAKLTAQAIAAECGIITVPAVFVSDIEAVTRPSSPQLSTDLDFPGNTKALRNSLRPKAIVLSGQDLMNLDSDSWDGLCRYDEIVFARTTPEQKLRIVKELKSRDEVVGSK